MGRHQQKTVVTQTPMRITLGGGGTDVLWYSRLKGGAWISSAINRYVYVKVSNSVNDTLLQVYDNGTSFQYENLNKLDNPIIKECLKILQVNGGLEISTQSEVSPKSGLGGSGAFEVGLLKALHIYKNDAVTPLTLAEEATNIEIKKLKKPVGPQDQYITALGGINYFELDKNGKISFEPLHLSDQSLSDLQNNLLCFQTGTYHDTEKVLGDQKSKTYNSDNQVIKSLDQIKELGQLAKQYLLLDKIDDFGQTLHEHWLIKKRLSEKVSSPQIDEWYETGIKNGALGGKIMGAGGGGWFVFYVNKNHSQFIEKMSQIGLSHQKIGFDFRGTRQTGNFEITPRKVFDFQSLDEQDSYTNDYLGSALSVLYQLSKQDIKKMVIELSNIKRNKGRLFLIGVGGSATNCSHAVNDFRKIAGIEAYTPIDNVSELTARVNDDGWDTVFINWLKGSNLTDNDAVLVFSVGGGNLEKNISVNIVRALEYAKQIRAKIFGIVSRDGGHTKKVADCCIMVPVIKDEFITSFAESFQALIWHLIVFSPQLREIKPY